MTEIRENNVTINTGSPELAEAYTALAYATGELAKAIAAIAQSMESTKYPNRDIIGISVEASK